MKLKSPEDGANAQRPLTERTGIPGRVEAATKMTVPPPKGKGLVMILIGVAVLVAVIYDFTGKGAASKKVREVSEKQAAREAAAGGQLAPTGPGEALELTFEGSRDDGQAIPTLSSAAAVVYFTIAPEAKQAELRPAFFAALAAIEDLKGRRGQEAFELASRLLEGAGPASEDAIADLTIKALKALGDDTAAPAAILFVATLEDGIGKLTARALDKVILDRSRPLHIRAAAAHARPVDGRPEKVSALAEDARTHPALRAALRAAPK